MKARFAFFVENENEVEIVRNTLNSFDPSTCGHPYPFYQATDNNYSYCTASGLGGYEATLRGNTLSVKFEGRRASFLDGCALFSISGASTNKNAGKASLNIFTGEGTITIKGQLLAVESTQPKRRLFARDAIKFIPEGTSLVGYGSRELDDYHARITWGEIMPDGKVVTRELLVDGGDNVIGQVE